ncbi:MAG: LysM peptidoglycan-binding domain-containing protein [Thermodesulfobacteriota bacterium]|jgi:hypothetical protein
MYSLLVLAGIGFVFLLARSYFESPEEHPAAKFPVQTPPSQETVAFAPSEAKSDLTAETGPKVGTDSTASFTDQDSNRPASAAPQEVKEPLLTVPTIETKPAPTAPLPEVKPSVTPPLKEIKKETERKEAKKETRPKESDKKTKSTSPDSKNAESKNSIEKSDNKTVMVKAGDSIYTIAEKTYKVSNTSLVDRIMELNPKIANPDLLPANQKIRLPEITNESLVITSSDAAVKVRLGTFMKPEYANFLKGHPALQGKDIEIIPWKTPSGQTFYRATAGKFNSREEGVQVIRDLKEKGLSPYFEGFKKKN